MIRPAIVLPPTAGPPRASIVLLHGYAACAAVHRTDAAALRAPGIEVVLADAPGHGTRDDGRLAHLATLDDARRREAIVDLARSHADELPDLVADCRARGSRRIGLVGISMGGFAALRALAPPCPFAAVVALLAGPALVDRDAVTPGHPPLLLGLAGRDEAVPPEPGRRFAADYGAELLEYPESEHMMRGEDWHDLWRRAAAFLHGHLLVRGLA